MNYIIPFIRKDQEQIIQINLCEMVISFFINSFIITAIFIPPK
jgi:hypothetical protein